MSDDVAYEIDFSETLYYRVTVSRADIAEALGMEDGPEVGRALSAFSGVAGLMVPHDSRAVALSNLLHQAADYPEVDGVRISASRPVERQS